MNLDEHVTKLLARVPVPLPDGSCVAVQTASVTGITIVENIGQPKQYVIACGPEQHFHTESEEAIREISAAVLLQMISRTTVTARVSR